VLLIDPTTPAAAREQLARRFGAAALLHCDEAWPRDADAIAVQTLPAGRALPGVHAIKLTSGSTGKVRGIASTGAELLADTAALSGAMAPPTADRIVAAVPMSFTYGLGNVTVPALALGLPLVLPAPGNPFNVLAAARACAATFLPRCRCSCRPCCGAQPHCRPRCGSW
jgi:acyl-coenzyme A synthetase/AMP-(fatty) acid ligase